MRLLRFSFAIVLLAVLFLVVGHRSWLSREVVVSVGLKAPVPIPCQVFYTDRKGAGFVPEKVVTLSVGPRGNKARVSLPVGRLEGIRFDFGIRPGNVRASRVILRGTETCILDWRDFRIRHDIGRFDVDAVGAVDVESVGGDPCAVYSEPLGLRGRLRVNAFAFAVLVVLSAFAGLALAAISAAWRRFAAMPQRERMRTAAFLLVVFALVAARFALVARIPPWFGPSSWDDGWFANAASSLRDGLWLGPYNEHTLIKGCFGPMAAAAASLVGVPFLVTESMLYAAGCLFSLYIVSHFARNRVFLSVILVLLLFHPLSFSLLTWQRVYRNGMPLWQVPFVVGCLFQMLRSARGRIRWLTIWAIASGVALWAFQNTREDGIWLWPFVLVCLAVSAVRARTAGTRRERHVRTAVCCVPLFVFLAGNAALCAANWRVYGVPIRNDRDSGNYAKAMRDLYLIKPDPDDEARLSSPAHNGHYHNIFYSTLCKAYDASPTLAGARREIDYMIDVWAGANHYSGRDLRLDHVLFAIRLGASRAGHYRSLKDSEEFFGRIHGELLAAFSDGRLSRRGVSITAMAAPFRREFIPCVFREWWRALVFVARFPNTTPEAVFAGDSSPRSAGPDMIPAFRRASASVQPPEKTRPAVESAVRRATAVVKVWSALFPGLSVAAFAGYFFLTVLFLLRPPFRALLRDGWLLATALLGGILAHTSCIAYVTATTFGATSTHYLAASFQLLLLFVVVVAGLLVQAAGVCGWGLQKNK